MYIICDYIIMIEIDRQLSFDIQYPKRIDSQKLWIIIIHGYSSSIFKMAYHCSPSISAHSASMDTANCVFHRSLVESAEPNDSES